MPDMIVDIKNLVAHQDWGENAVIPEFMVKRESRRYVLQRFQHAPEPGRALAFRQLKNLHATHVFGAVMGFSQQKSCIQCRKSVHATIHGSYLVCCQHSHGPCLM